MGKRLDVEAEADHEHAQAGDNGTGDRSVRPVPLCAHHQARSRVAWIRLSHSRARIVA
jgi:hypothetical protein